VLAGQFTQEPPDSYLPEGQLTFRQNIKRLAVSGNNM